MTTHKPIEKVAKISDPVWIPQSDDDFAILEKMGFERFNDSDDIGYIDGRYSWEGILDYRTGFSHNSLAWVIDGGEVYPRSLEHIRQIILALTPPPFNN